MSPRKYQAGERRLAATAVTRGKIIDAARALLSDADTAAFSIDAVAERADVARMTVYYQFKSKAKLLEALFDNLAERSNARDMRKVFEEADLSKSLALLVEVFCNLWKTEAPLLRRLAAMAALDPEVGAALNERGNWRREALCELLRRLPNAAYSNDLPDVLYALTSFETYEMLRAGRRQEKIPSVLKQAVSKLCAADAR